MEPVLETQARSNAKADEEQSIRRVEINYRGIFQKTLGYRIAKDLVYVAHSEKKTAFFNGRYSDDPQRNGVPCANFAFISDKLSEEELEAIASARMDIDRANVVIVLDDTMAKGVEPWGHYGIRPINEKIVPGGTLLVVSRREPREIVPFLERKAFTYKIAILQGDASFAGLWYFKDDGTDVRVLGALAKVAPEVIGFGTAKEYVKKTYKDERKVSAFEDAYNNVRISDVGSEDGMPWPYPKPVLPAWTEFDEGIVVKAAPNKFELGPRGLGRNPDFKRGTSRTQRPVVRFDLCTKCTLCWNECPDECFDPTRDGLYDVNYDYCTGCGRCAEVCPVNECIVMVDELNFQDNKSPWEMYRKDPAEYARWVEDRKGRGRTMPSFVTGKGPTSAELQSPIPFKAEKQEARDPE